MMTTTKDKIGEIEARRIMIRRALDVSYEMAHIMASDREVALAVLTEIEDAEAMPASNPNAAWAAFENSVDRERSRRAAAARQLRARL